MGREPLATLRDAALPKAEHDADEWQAAMEALLLVAEQDGPTMFCSHRCHRGALTGYGYPPAAAR
jgi:hypothetical protein